MAKSEQEIREDARLAKEQGWVRTDALNAGRDSYRSYENSKTGESRTMDGKNELHHLSHLAKR